MNATACSSAAADSGWAPAPERCPFGAPVAATSPCRAFMNKPKTLFPALYPTSLLLNLTYTSSFKSLQSVESDCRSLFQSLRKGNVTRAGMRGIISSCKWKP